MHLSEIRGVIQKELADLDLCIQDHLSTSTPVITELSHYIIQSGGKRLRPLLHLLCAKMLMGSECRTQTILLAAIIEFIHTATLLHDDVVDDSTQRRGQATANTLWGNASSVLVGDFLYSRAFQMMVKVQHMGVMDILSRTTNTIAEGEVIQLSYRHNPDITALQYFDVIHRKTATLFEAAAVLAGVLGEVPLAQQEALATFGLKLGIAFQMLDDLLDYEGDPELLGKNLGDDLAEGKVTLPLIITIERSAPPIQIQLKSLIRTGARQATDLPFAQHALHTTGALATCHTIAQQHLKEALRALSIFPENEGSRALKKLAHLATHRAY